MPAFETAAEPESTVPLSAVHSTAQPTPLDLWLSRELRRCYDETLAEPVPPELLRLLQPG